MFDFKSIISRFSVECKGIEQIFRKNVRFFPVQTAFHQQYDYFTPGLSPLQVGKPAEYKKALTVNSAGEEMTSSGRLFTESVIKEGDIIETAKREFKVISVTPNYPLTDTFCVINEAVFA